MNRDRSFFAATIVLVGTFASFAVQCGELLTEPQAVHVLNRLGYGPRPGDIERVRQMGVDQYIELQLNPAAIPMPVELTQRLDQLEVLNQTAGQTLADFVSVRDAAKNDDTAKAMRHDVVARIMEQTAEARIVRALYSPRQLEEVMVDFWFNHFNVFAGKGLDRALVASYERDAIRPHALGSFRDLLGATAKHPAMLFYLDNWLSASAGDRSGASPSPFPRGLKAKSAGLNENYARELMELHTLGVDGGYSQRDVTELARMLTGWTFQPRALMRNNVTFHFDAARHDQADKEWMGRHIAAQGQREGELALDVLALHPATARHISYKLAQYFVQDAPPEILVERLARRYLEVRGDIRSVLRTLFFSPEFRAASAVGTKFKTPFQFILSAARADDFSVWNVRPLLGMLSQLGMPLYGCQTPDGYRNTAQAWLNPDALARRLNFATALASGRLPLTTVPRPNERFGMGQRQWNHQADAITKQPELSTSPVDGARLLDTLGSSISARTRATIASNPTAMRASMILGSPDFMQH